MRVADLLGPGPVVSQSAPIGDTVNEAAKAVGQHMGTIARGIYATRPETVAPLCPQQLHGRLLVEVDEPRRWVKSRPECGDGR